jgi:hypothetical protein
MIWPGVVGAVIAVLIVLLPGAAAASQPVIYQICIVAPDNVVRGAFFSIVIILGIITIEIVVVVADVVVAVFHHILHARKATPIYIEVA